MAVEMAGRNWRIEARCMSDGRTAEVAEPVPTTALATRKAGSEALSTVVQQSPQQSAGAIMVARDSGRGQQSEHAAATGAARRASPRAQASRPRYPSLFIRPLDAATAPLVSHD